MKLLRPHLNLTNSPKVVKKNQSDRKKGKKRRQKIYKIKVISLNEYTSKNCSDPFHTPTHTKRLKITFQKKKKYQKVKNMKSYQMRVISI